MAKSRFTLGGKAYDYGTIMVPVKNQKLDAETLKSFLKEVAEDSRING